MVDFSHIKQLAVTAANTAEYPLVEIEGAPVLIMRSANEGNSGYMNGLLRLTGQVGQRRGKEKELNAAEMEKMRENDRVLYPEHVIIGWRGMTDSTGADVPFSQEAVAAFLEVLPGWIFDGVRAYAMTPYHFVTTIDSAGKAKNLPKG